MREIIEKEKSAPPETFTMKVPALVILAAWALIMYASYKSGLASEAGQAISSMIAGWGG